MEYAKEIERNRPESPLKSAKIERKNSGAQDDKKP
jgi:hypothetical protein